MTQYTTAQNFTSAPATMSAEAAFSCAFTGRFCARNHFIAMRLDTIVVVSIFIMPILWASLILTSLLPLALICLLILVCPLALSKEQPHPF